MIAGDRQKMQSVFLAELDLNPATTDSSIDYRQFIHTSLAPNIRVGTRLDPDEELYLKEFITHYRLSPSDLNKFLEDPRLFLRDVVFRFPFLDNEFTIFGKVYHRALELFHLEYRDTHEIPSEEHLVKSFLSLLSRENLTHEEEKRLREKGEKGLRGWYQQAVPTIRLPLHLEFNFYHRNIFLDDTIPLTGKIDKIEALDTDGKRVRLVDYKTGRPKSLKEIKGETAGSDGKYFRQLLFYVVMA
jgi:ATP-dependent exoDNAse (exonuclease V) beta subunit